MGHRFEFFKSPIVQYPSGFYYREVSSSYESTYGVVIHMMIDLNGIRLKWCQDIMIMIFQMIEKVSTKMVYSNNLQKTQVNEIGLHYSK